MAAELRQTVAPTRPSPQTEQHRSRSSSGFTSESRQELSPLLTKWRAEQEAHAAAAVFQDQLPFTIEASSRHVTLSPELPSVCHIDLATVKVSSNLRVIGGLDISYRADGEEGVVVLAILSFPDLCLIDTVTEIMSFIDLPYAHSFLGAREALPFARLLGRVRGTEQMPQILFVDGNGRLHPRQAGSAVSVGVLTGLPTIGVAKEYHPINLHDHVRENSPYLLSQKAMRDVTRSCLKNRGEWIPLFDEIGGAVLTSPAKSSTKPVFVSAGHRISLHSAVMATLMMCKEARVPEPIRQADKLGREEATRRWGLQ